MKLMLSEAISNTKKKQEHKLNIRYQMQKKCAMSNHILLIFSVHNRYLSNLIRVNYLDTHMNSLNLLIAKRKRTKLFYSFVSLI
jgi:mRNA-degrading endonuclease YafQ of YafQ-DinJ toxin-antitoxin module